MNRKVLLIEPNYKNKYPPMGLMKLATYYRLCNDDVRFFKGDLKKFAAELLFEEYFNEVNEDYLAKYSEIIIDFIRTGNSKKLISIPKFLDSEKEELLFIYRDRFKYKDFPKFDILCISSLFTFYWKQTIETINYAKNFCDFGGVIYIGGIAATLLPDYIFKETNIHPIIGLLDKPKMLDDNNIIIDDLPLDYSILEEIDYRYPMENSYFGYTTRGCPRKCSFCAVSELEPVFKNFISLKEKINYVDEHFGPKKNLLLLDNNILVSSEFNKIIDEIKECGFEKNSYYIPESEYDIAIRNLKKGYNIRGYINKIIKLYDKISEKLSGEELGEFYYLRVSNNLHYKYTATRENILKIDEIVRPLYNKHFRKFKNKRIIDFNQGIDARLVNEENIKRIAELNIKPFRLAFDSFSQKDFYSHAVKLASENGINYLSTYVLYNYNDTPEEFYQRINFIINLCEEYNVKIYSFPMKYHPIKDPDFFYNRDFIGEHWNKKFIRAIQVILNATKGKIGSGESFFNEAFGNNLDEFYEILWMPEELILNRLKYKNNITENWRNTFNSLSPKQKKKAKEIISKNNFSETILDNIKDNKICELLKYYQKNSDIFKSESNHVILKI